jgi:hypothetical protein
MKLTYRAANNRIVFEVEVPNEKAAFETVANLQEIFEEPGCGACNSTRIRQDVREVDGNKFFHLKCLDCAARLDFGQTKKGEHLFAKRRDESKQKLPVSGWYKYQPETGNGSQADTTLPDPDLLAIAAAKTLPALELIVKRLNQEIKAGTIPQERKDALLEAVRTRKGELTKGGTRKP